MINYLLCVVHLTEKLTDHALGVRQGDEPVLVEGFVAETTAEAFGECVLWRFAGLDESELDPLFVGSG